MEARILENNQLRVTHDPEEIGRALDQKLPLWIELQHKDDDCEKLLGQRLGLHALTIEDIWASRSQPKLEDYQTYLYLIVHGIADMDAHDVELHELDVILGPTYVITHDPGGLVDAVRAEVERAPRLLAKGPAWVAHAILDNAVDRYLPVIDALDRRIDDLEDSVLRTAGTTKGPATLRKILGFKRTLLTLRRMSIRQREILLQLARGDHEEIPPEAVPFYRDVYDHFLRVTDLIESYRDLVTNALEAYLSVQSNRMNEIMKTLTLISTVMLPITFIAGLYGMNFEFMPELKARWGYPASLLVMAAVVVAALVWFRRKGWIGAREFELPEDELMQSRPRRK